MIWLPTTAYLWPSTPTAILSSSHLKKPDNHLSLEEQLLGQKQPLTQIGRILNELGIQHIPALSPQAKGRIERSFETLQERLVVELRLAGAKNCEEVRIPPQIVHPFRLKSSTDSEANRPPIPEQIVRPFR